MSTPLPLESDPQDVALDTDGDILVDPLRGLVFVSGIPAVVQAVNFQLRLFFSEWFLNEDIGVQYFEQILGDASKIPGVEKRAAAILGAAILRVPAVETILKLVPVVNRSTRGMTVTWQARCAFGDTPEVTIEVAP